MISVEHIIARCHWKTQFDDFSYATKLQNAISQWSHQVLPGILNECFDLHCPVSSIWRIEKMELDLGVLQLQELDKTLPILIRTAIENALRHMHSQNKIIPSASEDKNFRIIDKQSSELSRIWCFLLKGISSWREGKYSDPAFLVDKQFEENPKALAELLRTAGKSETVRWRIIWQWGEPRIRKTVQILEPWHADFINSYADDLGKSQLQQPFPRISNRDFKLNIWYWIFTHLLIERGSLFDTRQFVRSTLYQMAEHYQLDFSELLHRLREVVNLHQNKGKTAPRFLQVLDLIGEEKEKTLLQGKLSEFEDFDSWQLFQQMLAHREKIRIREMDIISLSELFTSLAEEDSGRMAKIIRERGSSESDRLFMIKLFDHILLKKLVSILAPKESRFILTFIDSMQAMSLHFELPSELAWREIFDNLLSGKNSDFKQRLFIKTSVQKFCLRQHMEYTLFLSRLIGTRLRGVATKDNFKLMAILQKLQIDEHHNGKNCRSWYKQSVVESLTDTRKSLQTLLFLPAIQGHHLFFTLFEHHKWQRIDADKLSRYIIRELAAYRELDLCRLRAFFTVLSPQEGHHSFQVLLLLRTLFHHRLLPSLSADDPVKCLNTAVIESLLYRFGESGQNSLWKEHLLVILQRKTGIDKSYWKTILGLSISSAFSDSYAENTELYNIFHDLEAFDYLLEKEAVLTANRKELLRRFSRALNNDRNIFQVFPSIINHAESAQLLRQIGRSQNGEHWLGRFLPEGMQSDANRFRLWSQFAEIFGGEFSIDKPSLLSAFERSFWQIAQAKIQGHWIQHHNFAGFRSDSSEWITSLLKLLANQNDIRLTSFEIIIRQNSLSASSSGLDWKKILKYFCIVHYGSNSLSAERLQRMNTGNGNACGHEDGLKKYSLEVGQLAEEKTNVARKDFYEESHLLRNEDAECFQDSTGQLFYLSDRQLCLVKWLKTGSIDSGGAYFDPGRCLIDWINSDPKIFRLQIAPLLAISHVRSRLLDYLSVSIILDAMASDPLALSVEISTVEMLQKLLSQLSFPLMSRSEVDQLLFSCVLDAWFFRDWASLSSEQLILSIFWKILQGGSVSPLLLKKELTRPGLTIGYLLAREIEAFVEILGKNIAGDNVLCAEKSIDLYNEMQLQKSPYFDESDEIFSASQPFLFPLTVSNAGLVLLQSFIPALFERLELTKDQKFISHKKRRRAVQCLQFLATGFHDTSECFLVLNKVLCGMDIAAPVELSIYLTAEEQEVIESLIEAAIVYWVAIGNSSIDGFRGNWLIRNGTLTESRENWDLIIERQSYDVLITRAPLSYSIIKFPWMKKPLYVTWPV